MRRLASADKGMVRQIRSVRLEQRFRTQELHEKLGIISVTEEIRWRRLRYFSNLQRMDKNLWQRRVNDYVAPGILTQRGPQLRWSDVVIKDLKDLNIRKELADTNGQNGKEQLCQEKYNCEECDPPEVGKHYKRWVR